MQTTFTLKGFVRLCIQYAVHVCEVSTQTALLNTVKSKAFISPLLNRLPFASLLSFTAIFMLKTPLNLLTVYLHFSCGLTTQNAAQYSLPYFSLVNSEAAFLRPYLILPTTTSCNRKVAKRPSNLNWSRVGIICFDLVGVVSCWLPFSVSSCPWPASFAVKKSQHQQQTQQQYND